MTARRSLPPSAPRRARHCLALAFALLLAGPWAGPAVAADSQRLRYFVWVGGAAVFDLTLRWQLDETRYALALDGVLVGVPSIFYDLAIAATADGRLAEQGPLPRDYRLEIRDDGRPEWLRLEYDESGLPRRSAEPPLGDEGRAPLSAEAQRGTLDPLGAILGLLLQTGAEACAGRATVFDGRRRFDVVFTDRGPGELGFSPYNVYAGEVRECRVTLTPRGGFRRSGRDLEAFPRELTLFLGAGGAGALPLPVRIESESSLGAMIIHLVEAESLPR